MTKRIFRSVFLASASITLACLMIITGFLFNIFQAVQKKQLAVQTDLAAHGVENEGASYLDGLESDGCRITWVAPDGRVLFDSENDAAQMENHASREEIAEAFKSGVGESERYSSTMLEKDIYRAKRLQDGSVLRVAVTQSSVWALLLGALKPMLTVFAATLLLSFVLAKRLSKRIVEPLNNLDLERPLENDAYEELSPLLTKIEHQRRKISGQSEYLKRRQDEFSAVTENMSEGLVLLNENNVILSINAAAARLFGTDNTCVGKSILTVNRSAAVLELTDAALNGKNAEKTLTLMGRTFQINASPVLSDGKTAGACLTAFDVTEKAQAERMRREFTANVSHELKTPLHAIMGAAELMENGLVKPEDINQFAGKIRSESSHLVTLIDDIIRLSQLDEGGDIPLEEVDLKVLSDEAAHALSTEAAEKNVTVTVRGEAVFVRGARRLLYEIIYNLCDNAVRYNIDGGSVDITINAEENTAVLTVSDTGIGIPAGHHDRVFERFYRVDKSHSRATGGTGLGLSIVKHAAEFHNAEILLKSTPGAGTTVTVKIPNGEYF